MLPRLPWFVPAEAKRPSARVMNLPNLVPVDFRIHLHNRNMCANTLDISEVNGKETCSKTWSIHKAEQGRQKTENKLSLGRPACRPCPPILAPVQRGM